MPFSVASTRTSSLDTTYSPEYPATGDGNPARTVVADPPGTNIRALLKKYTALRSDGTNNIEMTAILGESSQIQEDIWHELEQLAATEQATVYHSLLVQAINHVYDMHEERLFLGLRSGIPATIWLALYTVLVLSMMGVGFHFGIKGARSPVPSTSLALSFSMVLFLIADLDKPLDGFLKNDQSLMRALHERLESPGR